MWSRGPGFKSPTRKIFITGGGLRTLDCSSARVALLVYNNKEYKSNEPNLNGDFFSYLLSSKCKLSTKQVNEAVVAISSLKRKIILERFCNSKKSFVCDTPSTFSSTYQPFQSWATPYPEANKYNSSQSYPWEGPAWLIKSYVYHKSVSGGSIAQWLAYLLLDCCPGFNSQHSRNFFRGKNCHCCLG